MILMAELMYKNLIFWIFIEIKGFQIFLMQMHTHNNGAKESLHCRKSTKGC